MPCPIQYSNSIVRLQDRSLLTDQIMIIVPFLIYYQRFSQNTIISHGLGRRCSYIGKIQRPIEQMIERNKSKGWYTGIISMP
uniref:GSVIVT00018735001, GPEPC n=1 Tax=Arundo donax TaxID=35708 RepID=A0A0A9GE19_ARUDO